MTKCYNVYLLQISRVMFVVLWFYYITIVFVFNFLCMDDLLMLSYLLFLLYWIYYNLENFLSNEFSFLYILILYILLFRYSLSCISPTIDIIYCQSPVVVLFFYCVWRVTVCERWNVNQIFAGNFPSVNIIWQHLHEWEREREILSVHEISCKCSSRHSLIERPSEEEEKLTQRQLHSLI